ncbi:MAG: hypothetical protein ACOX7G_05635, partial [Candidatus Scatomorpha sp.]
IVDLTAYQVKSLQELYDACEDDSSLKLAFTTDPTTGRVDYIYVVKASIENTVTVSLSKELTDAGWSLEQSSFGDIAGDSLTVTLVNKNKDLGIKSDAIYSVTATGATATEAKGTKDGNKLTVALTEIAFNSLDNATVKIDGLKLTVNVSVASALQAGARITDGESNSIVLGESVTVVVKPVTGRLVNEAVIYTVASNPAYQTVTGKVMPKDNSTSITFYPLIGTEFGCSYELTQWVYELDA